MSSGAPTRIRSVAKAMRILLHVAQQDEGTTAKAAAMALDMPTPSVHHTLETFVDEGVLAKDSMRRYHLGPRIGALSDAFVRQTRPPEYLLDPLRQVVAETGETAYLSGWRHDDIVVLATIEGTHAVRVRPIHSGAHGNAHARASGKLLLALARPDQRSAYLRGHPLTSLTPNTIVDAAALETEFERIRRTGYALDREEYRSGVSCVAAPVVEDGVVLAAYTVTAPVDRFRARRQELTDAVVAAGHSVGSRGRAAAG